MLYNIINRNIISLISNPVDIALLIGHEHIGIIQKHQRLILFFYQTETAFWLAKINAVIICGKEQDFTISQQRESLTVRAYVGGGNLCVDANAVNGT